PKRLVARFAAIAVAPPPPPSRVLRAVTVLLSLVVLVRSYQPAANMLSPHQRMNGSFDPFHLVNTYGAFGSVGKQRDEVILQGTSDEHPGPSTRWLEYEFPCKPGDVMRRPCLISPYHYRLDWQMWFAALGNYQNEPFIVSLIYKLLHNEPATLSLLVKNPFPKAPPKLIRAERYRYAFTRWGDADDKRGAWWKRERLGPYLPPLAADNPEVLQFLVAHGYVAGETIDAGQ
ncbi:MAG TPA: lipase maturation factor family protein, partial [Polyangiales bacterium]|nr:lipase maturation factor family protein [Polyangiales bacterium]